MVSTIESPKAAITYEVLLGEGLGLTLGLAEAEGDGLGVGVGERTIAILVSPKVAGLGTGFKPVCREESKTQTKSPKLKKIKTTITILNIKLPFLLIGLFSLLYLSKI